MGADHEPMIGDSDNWGYDKGDHGGKINECSKTLQELCQDEESARASENKPDLVDVPTVTLDLFLAKQ